jgi:4-amino-4-deoxy-L-arabinose transferase-like glycosyltransferase
MDLEKIVGLGIFSLNLIIFFVLLFTQKYPPFLVISNLVSIIFIWIWILSPKKALNFFKEKKTDLFIAIVLFILSLAVLTYQIDTLRPGLYGDEMYGALNGTKLMKLKEMPPFINAYPQPLAASYLSGWSVGIFGNNAFALKFPGIVVGALSAIAVYTLLRLFFRKKLAIITSLIFVFSYQHLTIWREPYDAGEAVLFQTLALIFLYLFFKKKNIKSLIGFGFAIGAGVHFYLSFRTIALSMVVLSLLAFRGFPYKKILKYFVILFISVFISTAVLSSYTAAHWSEFWGRASAISVFGRNLPLKDVAGEILGSIKNDMGLFIFSGDPNPRYNPSGVPLYDFISSILIISGFVLLFFKQRKFFYIFLFLSISVIVNDIFSIEVFPEYHYYGTGHPNSLRISGFIPLFYLLMGFAFVNLESLLQKINKEFSNIALIFICIFVVTLNLYMYFGQASINPAYFVYNYRYGDAFALDIYKYINEKNIKEVYVQKPFINDQSYFFLNKNVTLKPIGETDPQRTIDLIRTSTRVVVVGQFVSTFEDADFFAKLMEKADKLSIPYVQLNTPFGPYGAVIFNSNQ